MMNGHRFMFVRMFLGLIPLLLWSSFAQGADRLQNATSPYLRQHIGDRVDWHPWNEAALHRARQGEKLIFLSIGYSSCHWCHKMARDTFADPRVADFLNEHFVAILVDREERPDLDGLYLDVARAMNGEAGWPLNVILTPDLLPLFASGYLPPRPRFGLSGLEEILRGIQGAWSGNRQALLRDEALIRRQLRELSEFPGAGEGTGADGVDPRQRAADYWLRQWDDQYGGFGRGAKFLHAEVLSLLLRRSLQTGDQRYADAVFTTLDQMAAGGVRDQLGGAFHRYSADRFWQIPHFEIMLYDNALMARVYLEAFQMSGRSRYAFVVRAILEDLLDRFRLPDGSFASALDADSADGSGHGREGAYYTWTPAETAAVLGGEDQRKLLAGFLNPRQGTVDGRAILRLQSSPATLVEHHRNLAPLLKQLRTARKDRPAPHRDEKVITAWNALTISAFALASRVLAEPRYLQVARTAMASLEKRAWRDGVLKHSRLNDQSGEAVFLDGYACLLQVLLDLYETDFNVEWLQRAARVADDLFEKFQTAPGQPFRLMPRGQTGPAAERVPLLNQEGVPSGNATALTALARLSLYRREEAFQKRVAAIRDGLRGFMAGDGHRAADLLRVLDFQTREAREVILVGPPRAAATRRLLRAVHDRFLPGTVIALLDPAAPAAGHGWSLLAMRSMLKGQPTAYVCVNALCKQPVTTVAELEKQLSPPRRREFPP